MTTHRLKDVVEDCADTEQGGNPKQHLFRENMRVNWLKIHSDGQPEMWRSRRRLPEFLSPRTEGSTSLLQHCCNESLLSRQHAWTLNLGALRKLLSLNLKGFITKVDDYPPSRMTSYVLTSRSGRHMWGVRCPALQSVRKTDGQLKKASYCSCFF